MDEMERYRNRIDRRRFNRTKTGRRRSDRNNMPKCWTWEVISQGLLLALFGLVLALGGE